MSSNCQHVSHLGRPVRDSWECQDPTHGVTMSIRDAVQVPWYVIENDLIGGWDISTVNKPASQHRRPGTDPGDIEVAWGLPNKIVAEYIVGLHNRHLSLTKKCPHGHVGCCGHHDLEDLPVHQDQGMIGHD